MFIGIDVAKAELVVGVRPTGTGWTAVNDDQGVRDLVTTRYDGWYATPAL